jgi:hypothetical protein
MRRAKVRDAVRRRLGKPTEQGQGPHGHDQAQDGQRIEEVQYK